MTLTVSHPLETLVGEEINNVRFSKPDMNGMGYDIDKMGYPLEPNSVADIEGKLLKIYVVVYNDKG